MIKVHSSRTDTTTHRAVIEDGELERLIASHVANAAGVDIDAKHVRAQCHVRTQMGSTNMNVRAEVTITIDHTKQPGLNEDAGEAA
ncbi:hypothetical protein [Caballeronia sp. AZ7_KS35]|uniref:hypothetical protein n=1 Tax=Caballeronia sp. AZ7_KS35 TaxID=2921762 RepID=UPI002028143B|nr:hypothetical protein [Caballeronia sp. AZ7_KS35]